MEKIWVRDDATVQCVNHDIDNENSFYYVKHGTVYVHVYMGQII